MEARSEIRTCLMDNLEHKVRLVIIRKIKFLPRHFLLSVKLISIIFSKNKNATIPITIYFLYDCYVRAGTDLSI